MISAHALLLGAAMIGSRRLALSGGGSLVGIGGGGGGGARALSEGGAFSTDMSPPALSPGELAGRVIGAVVLLCFSAIFSGLTLGLLGLDTNQLQILVESGTTSGATRRPSCPCASAATCCSARS